MPINSLISLWSIEDLLNMSHVGNVPGVLGERAQRYRVLSEQKIVNGQISQHLWIKCSSLVLKKTVWAGLKVCVFHVHLVNLPSGIALCLSEPLISTLDQLCTAISWSTFQGFCTVEISGLNRTFCLVSGVKLGRSYDIKLLHGIFALEGGLYYTTPPPLILNTIETFL